MIMITVKRDHEFEECMYVAKESHGINSSAKRCEACRIQRFTLGDVDVQRTDEQEI